MKLYKLIGKLPVPVKDMLEWAMAMHNREPHVALTELGPLTVSTVFLGIDHNWGRHFDAILFETMIHGDLDQIIELSGKKYLTHSWLHYQTRCATWDEAEKMHAEAVAWAEERLREINIVVEKQTKCSINRSHENC